MMTPKLNGIDHVHVYVSDFDAAERLRNQWKRVPGVANATYDRDFVAGKLNA